MSNTSHSYTRLLTTLVFTCVVAAFTAQPAAAQTAKKLKCSGCVKSKQLKNNGIRSKDIRNGQVKNPDLGDNAVTGGKIADGTVGNTDLAGKAVTLDKLGDNVTALGLSGVAVVPSSDFRQSSTTDTDGYAWLNNGYIRATSAAPKCVVAPVYLPDGVMLTEMELIHFDASSSDLTVGLRRKSLTVPGGSVEIASVTTFGNSGGASSVQSVSTTTFSETAVDAVNAFYTVRTCLETTSLGLIAVRVFYN